jgi:hypothetical protein
VTPRADDVAAPKWVAWRVVVADEASPRILELTFADIDPST